MEDSINVLVSYLVNLATSYQFHAEMQSREAEFAKATKQVEWRFGAITSLSSLKEELRTVSNDIARNKRIAGHSKVEANIIALLSDDVFQNDLLTWFVEWGSQEGSEAKCRLEAHFVNALKKSGANDELVVLFKNQYFELVDKYIFSNQALSNWRHSLALTDINAKVEELKDLAKIQLGQFSPETLEAALLRYRELALESCDIIDLAGLPEDDRHVAMQNFVLRQLYVPLRVLVANQNYSDLETQLRFIEQHRDQQRLTVAGRVDRMSEVEFTRVSIGPVIEEAKRVVVLGDPGSGKTTLLRWLATAFLLQLKNDPTYQEFPDVQTLSAQNYLPIIIRCRDLNVHCLEGSLDDVLRQTLRKAEMSPVFAEPLLAITRERLANGSALLLIDGLDEIANLSMRVKFCKQIERIATAYPEAKIVVTSRIVGYREMNTKIGHGFLHVTVAELIRQEKDEFARRWCHLTEPEERREMKSLELIEGIHSSDRVERLTGNPMLLTTMALVKRKVGKLPSRRSELYEEAVKVLLNWRAEVDEPIDWSEAIPQLEYIAYEMCRRGVQRLRQDEVLTLLDSVRREYRNIRSLRRHDAQEFLRLLERRTSILIESGEVKHDGRNILAYEFKHLTFQEYLAGLALIQGVYPEFDKQISFPERISPLAGQLSEVDRPYRQKINEYEVSEHWREALRLSITSCNVNDVDDALLAILKVREGEPSHAQRPRAILAAQCLADEPNVSEDVAAIILISFASSVKDDDYYRDTSGFGGAIKGLIRTEWGPLLERSLVKAATNVDDTKKVTLLRIYAGIKRELGQSYVVGLDYESLLNDDFSDQESLVAALFQFYTGASAGKVSNVNACVDRIFEIRRQYDSQQVIANELLVLLYEVWQKNDELWLPSEDQVSELIATIRLSPMSEEAISVSRIIEEIDKGILIEFIPMWLESCDEKFRDVALSWLAEEKCPQLVPKLIELVKEESASEEKTTFTLVIALANHLEFGVKDWFIGVNPTTLSPMITLPLIGRMKDLGFYEYVLSYLSDDDLMIVWEAVSALGNLGESKAIDQLVEVGRKHPPLHYVVDRTLGRIGGDRAFDLLISRAETESDGYYYSFFEAFGEMKDARAIEFITTSMAQDRSRIPDGLIAIGKIGDKQADALIRPYLTSEIGRQRASALAALARLYFSSEIRRLLSDSFRGDDYEDWIDPRMTIGLNRIEAAAYKLKISVDEVARSYREIAKVIPINLVF
ncbi:NACHT domain protein [compost metagenome]